METFLGTLAVMAVGATTTVAYTYHERYQVIGWVLTFAAFLIVLFVGLKDMNLMIAWNIVSDYVPLEKHAAARQELKDDVSFQWLIAQAAAGYGVYCYLLLWLSDILGLKKTEDKEN